MFGLGVCRFKVSPTKVAMFEASQRFHHGWALHAYFFIVFRGKNKNKNKNKSMPLYPHPLISRKRTLYIVGYISQYIKVAFFKPSVCWVQFTNKLVLETLCHSIIHLDTLLVNRPSQFIACCDSPQYIGFDDQINIDPQVF